ncbi:hypothetical protein [Chitinophaga sp. CF418]|uniref:hypothetical protein n=1 Tax=Chitinophaga sp. CF418 TaxID=1855287 RepID=UPI000923AF0C|nr:hypothetical protein [Chitinophaga sp. CF418]SHN45907.1 hypothetical protein SAMN05216311_12224 [Chitinophaga sp. CF418]
MIWINSAPIIKTFRSAQQQLGERKFNQAISRGLNEAILQGRTEARMAVKAVYNIPQRYVGGINIIKATSLSLEAKIYASTKPIPMDAFSPTFQQHGKALTISRKGEQKERAVKRRGNNAAGVTIEVLKGKKEVVPFAFMIPGAKPRVFARGEYRNSYGFHRRSSRVNKEGNDTPVKPLLSVTVHAAVINKKAMEKIERKVLDVYPKSVARNIEYMLSNMSS